jgi:hypothetical protein
VRFWLPKDAITGDIATAALSNHLARWGEPWFGARKISVARLRRDEVVPHASVLETRGTAASVEIAGDRKRRLLEALLDIDLTQEMRTEGDNHVLDALLAEVSAELVGALDELSAGTSVSPDEDNNVRATITAGAREILDIIVPEAALVPLIKAQIGIAPAANRAFAVRTAGLKGMRVTARATLGHAELSVADVRGLAPGDVLVLDRSLNQPVELCLAEGGSVFARGVLRKSETGISIQL